MFCKVRADRSCGATRGDILGESIVVPGPTLERAHIEEVDELGADTLQQFLEVAPHNLCSLDAGSDRDDEVAQPGRNHFELQVRLKICEIEIEGLRELFPAGERWAAEKLGYALIQFDAMSGPCRSRTYGYGLPVQDELPVECAIEPVPLVQHSGGSEQGMPGEVEFAEQVEDSSSDLAGSPGRLEKDGLEMPKLLRDRQHVGARKVSTVGEHGETVSRIRPRGKDVDVMELKVDHALRPSPLDGRPALHQTHSVVLVHQSPACDGGTLSSAEHGRMTIPQSIDTTLAGYRVVRKIGEGSRADLYLGASGMGTVVLKVFRESLTADDIAAELRALTQLDSPHLVKMLDVSRLGGGLPILVFSRVQRGSIAALLRDRGSIEPGEAVTLLAPLAGALPGMHRLGIAHTRISASSVYLGAAGEPVLLGFGHCVHFAKAASVAVLEADPSAEADRDAIAALALTVLAYVRGRDGDVRTLERWIETAPRQYDFAQRLEAKLFEFAEPEPIEFGGETVQTTAVPARTIATREVAVPAIAESPAADIPSWMQELILANPLAGLAARALAAAKTVRRPFWIAAGAIVVALVVALSVIPPGRAQGAPRKVVSAASQATGEPTPRATVAALPDDPLLALPILLTARNRCIGDLSVLCLDDVDEASSGAYTADSALIRQIQSGGEIGKSAVVVAPSPTLAERLGDVALVNLGPKGNTSAVELIREAEGWRIRGYLSGKQATT